MRVCARTIQSKIRQKPRLHRLQESNEDARREVRALLGKKKTDGQGLPVSPQSRLLASDTLGVSDLHLFPANARTGD
jgi:hypothetical protein